MPGWQRRAKEFFLGLKIIFVACGRGGAVLPWGCAECQTPVTRRNDMDFETLVQTRRSIRGYKPNPVPRAVIDEIIGLAKVAPSSMNTQPWHVHVLTGAPLERVRQRNTEIMLGGGKAN